MSASRLRGPLLTRRRVLRGLAGGGLGTLALGERARRRPTASA
ncbi:hypothetical protein ACFP9V_14555 [Deinococcus radiopugnans]